MICDKKWLQIQFISPDQWTHTWRSFPETGIDELFFSPLIECAWKFPSDWATFAWKFMAKKLFLKSANQSYCLGISSSSGCDGY